jgi:hypothetical protein
MDNLPRRIGHGQPLLETVTTAARMARAILLPKPTRNPAECRVNIRAGSRGTTFHYAVDSTVVETAGPS